MIAPRVPWGLILCHYAVGVFAAAQLGKVAALAPLMTADLGLGLTTMALATSLIEIGGAMLGVVAGGLAARVGLRRTLLGAVACLALGSAGAGTAQAAASLIAWRVLEAAGYLGVIVSVPVLIVRAAGPRTQGTALALWSSFVPVGLALGAWGHVAVAAWSSWRGAMYASAALGAVVGGLLWALHARSRMSTVATDTGAVPSGPARRSMPIARPDRPALSTPIAIPPTITTATATAIPTTPPPATTGAAATRRAMLARLGLGAPLAAWCLAASFGCYALFQVGVLALLPSLLTHAGMSVPAAASWTGIAALATLAGSAAAAWLLSHGRGLRSAAAVSLVGPALMAFAVFAPGGGALPAAVAAVALNMGSGVFGSLGFAMVPGAAGSADRMPLANGLLAQFGATGSLLGPPLMAAAAERWGWGAAAVCGLIVALIGVPLAWVAVTRSRGGRTPVRSPAPG